jgi:Tol biopolymer transport system component
VFAPPDTVLFLRQGTAFAQRLDLTAGELEGDPVEVARQIMFDGAFNAAAITSGHGLIAYRTGSGNELLWVDRAGKSLGVVQAIAPSSQYSPEISPDGRRVALDRTVNGNRDIWVLDLSREVASRFTFDTGIDATPIWSPDGARIAFRSNRTGVNQIYVKAAGGVAAEERLPTFDLGVGVSDWSRDGRTLLFGALDPATSLDLWALPIGGDGTPFPVAQTPFEERDGQLSPDGRWVAYTSNASGRPEVYVQAFPEAAERWQVSTGGGSQPRWRGDGAELFYVAAGGMMTAVSFAVNATAASPSTGTPIALFPARIVSAQGGLLRHQYAVTADGQRFLLNAVAEDAANAPVTVVANWPGFAPPR